MIVTSSAFEVPYEATDIIYLGLLGETVAGVELGEAVDAQTVGRMHFLVEELAGGFADRAQLDEVGRRQQVLSVFFGDFDVGSVGILDQLTHRLRIHSCSLYKGGMIS